MSAALCCAYGGRSPSHSRYVLCCATPSPCSCFPSPEKHTEPFSLPHTFMHFLFWPAVVTSIAFPAKSRLPVEHGVHVQSCKTQLHRDSVADPLVMACGTTARKMPLWHWKNRLFEVFGNAPHPSSYQMIIDRGTGRSVASPEFLLLGTLVGRVLLPTNGS